MSPFDPMTFPDKFAAFVDDIMPADDHDLSVHDIVDLLWQMRTFSRTRTSVPLEFQAGMVKLAFTPMLSGFAAFGLKCADLVAAKKAWSEAMDSRSICRVEGP